MAKEFKQEYVEMVFNIFKSGGTQAMFCEKVNISGKTMTMWKNRYPEFNEAIKKGKSLKYDIP